MQNRMARDTPYIEKNALPKLKRVFGEEVNLVAKLIRVRERTIMKQFGSMTGKHVCYPLEKARAVFGGAN